MAEVLLATAWAAGVVEGGSVLVHAAKNDKVSNVSPTLAVPSLLYGTLALPLSVVGASPGPYLISKLPFAPTLNALEVQDVEPIPSESTHKDELKQQQETETSENGESKDEEVSRTISKRNEMIRIVRETNRRNLARKQQLGAAPIPWRQPPNPRRTSKLLSGLDGRPLMTPLAEAMRRGRFLFIGGALVMSMISYEETSRKQETIQTRPVQVQQRLNNGRDIGAIESLVHNAKNGHGAVIRLVGCKDNLKSLTARSSGVTVPLVYNDNKSLPTTTDKVAYWNLGSSVQEWKLTPLTKDWLFRPTSSASFLVLEADVSPTRMSVYLSRQGDEDSLLQDRALWVSTILGMVARQKKVLPQLNDDETNADPLNVLLGFGDSKRTANCIYVNGPAAVGVEVSSLLERMHNQLTAKSQDTTTTELSAKEGYLEFIGRKLREGSAHTVNAVARLLTSRSEKVVHVLSDDASIAQWVQETLALTNKWIVTWYNPHDGSIERYREVAARNDSVSFVCCQSDEATCSVICSLLTNDPTCNASVVALVRDESCASTLRDVCAELGSRESSIEILSVASIHNCLFEHVRDLLASGKAPSEVQESIDLIQ